MTNTTGDEVSSSAFRSSDLQAFTPEALAAKLRDAYTRVFSTEDGETVLANILRECGFDANGIERPAFYQGMPFEDVARNEGAKGVGRHVLRMARGKVKLFEAEEKKQHEQTQKTAADGTE